MSEKTRASRVAIRSLAALVAGATLMGGTARVTGQSGATGWKAIAWNNLGMHCMDADYGVFAILPPFNTIQAHVIDPNGRLVSDPASVKVTYDAVADPQGSLNATSVGKTNFWAFALPLFGASLPPDVGLLNANMPGAANVPQPMSWDPARKWFIAEGIPITPYDDRGVKNYYPLMRVKASDAAGRLLASTNIVLPVSDEMDCTACHGSGSGDAARPLAGWVTDASPQRAFRLNILRLHDDRQLGDPVYMGALSAKGYSASGLFATANGGTPILCASCHRSEALAPGIDGISALTTAMHAGHADVIDPTNQLTLESNSNRSACYRCHPGSETRCLRGAMGNAVASDGTMAIQCQNCHGSMKTVGVQARTGWLQEPTCQQCHTGTATSNSGAIRFTSVFDSTGAPRVAANLTFATTANAPAAGLSLYRFSTGHGGLQCSACHGSTHAEFPSSHANDNLQSVALQGHVGTIAECSACHSSVPSTTNGGPHGMHPVGATWVSTHGDAAEGNRTRCQTCHGADYRGSVLSRTFAARSLSTEFGTKKFFRGAQVGCYACHNGPNSESANRNRPPVAVNVAAATSPGQPAGIGLSATDPDGNALTLRIVSQPQNGTVSLQGTQATYFPYPGFTGVDTFTYAAWDGAIDSNLATVTATVKDPTCTLAPSSTVPATATAGAAVTVTATAGARNCSGPATFRWTFGDGSPDAFTQTASHAFVAPGTFHWMLTVSADGASASRSGDIVVMAPAPRITGVQARSNPFSLQVSGANFQTGVTVFIASDTAPWLGLTRQSEQRLLLTGSTLMSRFPRNTTVAIRVVNPDGQSASTTFRR